MKNPQPVKLFGSFLFLILPFAYFEITQDPETTLRYLLISSFLVVFSAVLFNYRRKMPSNIEVDPLTFSLAAYFIVSVVSLLKTINTGDGVFEAGKTGVMLITMIFLSTYLKPSGQLKHILPITISFASLIFLSAGIYQLSSLQLHENLSRHSSQVVSFLSNKNFFGETLLLMIPFSLYVAVTQKGALKWFAVISIIFSLLFILYIQSLTIFIAAFLSISLIGILAFLFSKKLFGFQFALKHFIVIIISLTVIVSVPVTLALTGKLSTRSLSLKLDAAKFYFQNPDQIYNSTSGKNNNSLYDRAFLAKNSIAIFKENPIAGVGIGNWEILLPKYGLYGNHFMSIGRVRFEHPHNDYLLVLSETGLSGLLCWLVMFGFGIYYALIGILKNANNDTRWLMICLFGNLISFGILSMFSYPKERVFSMLLLMTTFAMIIVYTSSNSKKIKLPFTVFIVSVFMSSLFFTYVNYQRYRSEISLYAAFHFQKKEMFRQMQNLTESAISPFHTLDQSGTPLRWYLGQAYYYQGNQQKAFDNYLIASGQNPFHMHVLNDLGALYEAKGDHVNAANCFERVFDINPDFPDSKFNMVAVYFNSGETEKAYDLLRTIKANYTEKWQSTLQTILFAKTEKMIQATQDSVLANIINFHLQSKPKYLIQQYNIAESNGISFEEQIISLKHPK